MDPVMNMVMHFQQLGIYCIGALLIMSMGMVDKINMFSTSTQSAVKASRDA